MSTEERIREVGAATTSESHNWFGASHQSMQLAFTRQNTQVRPTKNKIEVHVLLRTISDDQTAIKGLTQADKQNTRISVVKGQPDEISTYIARRSKRLHQ